MANAADDDAMDVGYPEELGEKWRKGEWFQNFLTTIREVGDPMQYVVRPEAKAVNLQQAGDTGDADYGSTKHLDGTDQLLFHINEYEGDYYADEDEAAARFQLVVKAALKIKDPKIRIGFFEGLARYLQEDGWANNIIFESNEENGFTILPERLQNAVKAATEIKRWDELLVPGVKAGGDTPLVNPNPPEPLEPEWSGADAAFIDFSAVGACK